MRKWLLAIAGVLALFTLWTVILLNIVKQEQSPPTRPPRLEMPTRTPIPVPDMQAMVEAMYKRDMPNDKVACEAVKRPQRELVWCDIFTAAGEAMVVMGQYDLKSIPGDYLLERHIGITYYPPGRWIITCPNDENCVTDYDMTPNDFAQLTEVVKTLWIQTMDNYR